MSRPCTVEVGSHEALMEQQGAYHRLYQTQARQAKTDQDVLSEGADA